MVLNTFKINLTNWSLKSIKMRLLNLNRRRLSTIWTVLSPNLTRYRSSISNWLNSKNRRKPLSKRKTCNCSRLRQKQRKKLIKTLKKKCVSRKRKRRRKINKKYWKLLLTLTMIRLRSLKRLRSKPNWSMHRLRLKLMILKNRSKRCPTTRKKSLKKKK